MNTVHVTASREYDVCIGSGLLRECGERIREVTGACAAAIVADSHVAPLYGDAVRRSLEAAGFRVVSYVFPAGEGSKTLAVYGDLLRFLARERFSRSDIVAALGGGVTGDLAGFAAATYQRGVRFVQLPTTVLAAVDSSVGGKTAVDLPEGKNLAGAFAQPSLVLCDTDALSTLPPAVRRDGCAEIIKYGVLAGEDLFSDLERADPERLTEDIMTRCVSIKRDVVTNDEFDTGARRLLNLGHTAGHAIELCADYGLSHGAAVSMGLALIVRAAAAMGLCPGPDSRRVCALLERYGLPTETPFRAEALAEAAMADKKRQGGTLPLVVPYGIGDCRIHPIPAESFTDWLRAGGAK